MTATLGRITIYPIKSLDGVDVESVTVLPGGALENDRRYALVDGDGHYVNGKRTAAVNRVRATFDLGQLVVRFAPDAEFSLQHQQREIGHWLSEALGIACRLTENATAGFPDDTDSPGPTLISTATLEQVATWFPGVSLAEARRRFRANLELDGVEPFWEDRLVGPAGVAIPFRIGAVRWWGTNPCQRCVVPSRDSETGDVTPNFQKSFAVERERQLPEWAPRARFNHFYRLAVNTRLAPDQTSGKLQVGDRVEVDLLQTMQPV
jgi:MOSC domain-containing protein